MNEVCVIKIQNLIFINNSLFLNSFTASFLLKIIVIHFDAEDDEAARCGDEVGNQQGPQNLGFVQQSLHHEAEAADGHHQEPGQRDAVGVACLDGLNGLRQVAQHQSKTGNPSADLINDALFHIRFVFRGKYSCVS